MENPGVKSPLKDRQALTPLKPIHAPTGKELSCKGWHQEAALRMLMNSLDPAVTECREEPGAWRGIGQVSTPLSKLLKSLRTRRACWSDPASRWEFFALTETRHAS